MDEFQTCSQTCWFTRLTEPFDLIEGKKAGRETQWVTRPLPAEKMAAAFSSRSRGWITSQKNSTVKPRYVELGYLEHPAISNCISLPLAEINPGYLELYFVPNEINTGQNQSGSAVRAPRDKMYWKLRNVLTSHGNESKVRLTGLRTTANADGDKLSMHISQF